MVRLCIALAAFAVAIGLALPQPSSVGADSPVIVAQPAAPTCFCGPNCTCETCRCDVGGYGCCSAKPDDHYYGNVYRWYGYAEGRAEAEKSGKPVFIKVTTDSCPPCKVLDAALSDMGPELKPFVLIRVDGTQDAASASALGTRSFPRILVYGSDFELRACREGAVDAETIRGDLQKAFMRTQVVPGTVAPATSYPTVPVSRGFVVRSAGGC